MPAAIARRSWCRAAQSSHAATSAWAARGRRPRRRPRRRRRSGAGRGRSGGRAGAACRGPDGAGMPPVPSAGRATHPAPRRGRARGAPGRRAGATADTTGITGDRPGARAPGPSRRRWDRPRAPRTRRPASPPARQRRRRSACPGGDRLVPAAPPTRARRDDARRRRRGGRRRQVGVARRRPPRRGAGQASPPGRADAATASRSTCAAVPLPAMGVEAAPATRMPTTPRAARLPPSGPANANLGPASGASSRRQPEGRSSAACSGVSRKSRLRAGAGSGHDGRDRAQVVVQGGAVVARGDERLGPLEVGALGVARGEGGDQERVVVGLVVGQVRHVGPQSPSPRNRPIEPSSRSRSARRPRWIRDLTVPSDTPVSSAISA